MHLYRLRKCMVHTSPRPFWKVCPMPRHNSVWRSRLCEDGEIGCKRERERWVTQSHQSPAKGCGWPLYIPGTRLTMCSISSMFFWRNTVCEVGIGENKQRKVSSWTNGSGQVRLDVISPLFVPERSRRVLLRASLSALIVSSYDSEMENQETHKNRNNITSSLVPHHPISSHRLSASIGRCLLHTLSAKIQKSLTPYFWDNCSRWPYFTRSSVYFVFSPVKDNRIWISGTHRKREY